MIVKEASYETSEPTVNSQVVTLQGSGADVFLIAATPKFAAQAIRKSYDLGWNAAALRQQRLAVDRDRPEAGRARQVEGPHHRLDYGKDVTDRAMEGRSRRQAMEGLQRRNTCRERISSTPTPPMPSAPRRRWSRCSSSAATTCRATTSCRQAANLKDFAAADAAGRDRAQHLARPTTARSARCSSRPSTARAGSSLAASSKGDRPKAARVSRARLCASPAVAASPNSGQHCIEDRIGRDDRNSASQR